LMGELGVGQRVSYFELPDQQDYPWSLSGQLEVGPVVLVFYRGDW
jgi:peroxiredoxin